MAKQADGRYRAKVTVGFGANGKRFESSVIL